MRRLAIVTALAAQTGIACAQETPPDGGRPPTFTTRALTPIANAQAVTRRHWAPALDDGYVPQGLTFVDGMLYVATYRSTDPKEGKGPCRLFRIDPRDGRITGALDLPPRCGHAGGAARGPRGTLFVVDTHEVFEIALDSGPDVGRVVRSTRLGGTLRGAFAASRDGRLWIGGFTRGTPARLHALPFAALKRGTVSDADATATLDIASEVQGAAFDATGALWLTRSTSKFGELLKIDAAQGHVLARHAMPIGIEDISFAPDGALWTISEAGSRRWATWAGFHPLLLEYDLGRLK